MTIQPLLSIREFTLEKNLTSVNSARKPSFEVHTSPNIRGRTQGRNRTNAVSVGKPSARLQTSFSIRNITLEKSDCSLKKRALRLNV